MVSDPLINPEENQNDHRPGREDSAQEAGWTLHATHPFTTATFTTETHLLLTSSSFFLRILNQ